MKKFKFGLLALLIVAVLGSMSLGLEPKKLKPSAKKIVKVQEVRCPITGGKVDPAKTKLKTVYKGKTYYFCCAGCPEEFAKNPGKYAK